MSLPKSMQGKELKFLIIQRIDQLYNRKKDPVVHFPLKDITNWLRYAAIDKATPVQLSIANLFSCP